VNQDCFTVTLDEVKARGSSSKDVIYGCLWDWAPQDYLNNGWEQGNTLNEQYAILPPFAEGTLATSSGYKQGTLAITDKCTDPAAVMKWVDQYYSEEGAIVGKNGVEGISWEWLEDGTWDAIMDEEGKSMINGYNKVQGAANHPGLYPTEFQLKNANVSWITGEHAEIVKVAAEPWPSLQYNEEEKETLSVVHTDIKEYVWEYLSNVVIGEMDLESTWDAYLDTLNDMKLNELKTIVQNAYTSATAK
jgi:putative aldouronate transport system substrate-binding protein